MREMEYEIIFGHNFFIITFHILGMDSFRIVLKIIF